MIRLKNLLLEITLSTDNEFRQNVKSWEGTGPVDTAGNHFAYDDAYPKVPAKPGVQPRGTLTIGYGTTAAVLPTLRPGMKINHAAAESLLTKGIVKHEIKARGLVKKYDSYPKYLRAAILNAIYRGDLGPVTIKTINAGQWDSVATRYLQHPNFTNPGKYRGVVARMQSNANNFMKYAKELKIKKQAKTPSSRSGSAITGVVGKMIYPSNRASTNYANVRTSPEVNTGLINNFKVKVTWPNPVGKVISTKLDDRMNTWYQVKLAQGNGSALGWVRFDNVTTDKNAKYR